MPRKTVTPKQHRAGVHAWLILMKAFQSLMPHAQESIARTGLGDSDFRVLEALLHKGPLPVNTIGPKVWLTPGPSVSPSIAWFEKDSSSEKNNPPIDGSAALSLRAKVEPLITATFRKHAAAMENVVGVLSKKERTALLRLLKKLGKHAERTGAD